MSRACGSSAERGGGRCARGLPRRGAAEGASVTCRSRTGRPPLGARPILLRSRARRRSHAKRIAKEGRGADQRDKSDATLAERSCRKSALHEAEGELHGEREADGRIFVCARCCVVDADGARNRASAGGASIVGCLCRRGHEDVPRLPRPSSREPHISGPDGGFGRSAHAVRPARLRELSRAECGPRRPENGTRRQADLAARPIQEAEDRCGTGCLSGRGAYRRLPDLPREWLAHELEGQPDGEQWGHLRQLPHRACA